MKYLGIDYGAKRVGLAVSDEEGKMAFPHSVVRNDKRFFEEIKTIIEKENIKEIVMGESKNFKGESNEIMKEINNFKKKFEVEIGLPIHFEQEFLTSQQAKKVQGENKMHDASAAALILQSFLDRKFNML